MMMKNANNQVSICFKFVFWYRRALSCMRIRNAELKLTQVKKEQRVNDQGMSRHGPAMMERRAKEDQNRTRPIESDFVSKTGQRSEMSTGRRMMKRRAGDDYYLERMMVR